MRKWFDGGLLLVLCVLLFRYPKQSMAGAGHGLSLCLDLLIPSLFPFFVLSSLFIATGLAGLCAKPLEKIMRPVFGVGGAGAIALVLGLVGGYPVGARTIAQLVRQGNCSLREARRLSLFCNNCGPAFFLGAVGTGVFGSVRAGTILLLANGVSALLLGVFSRILLGAVPEGGHAPKPAFSPIAREFPEAVKNAFSSTLGVCSYVILFSVLVSLMECTGIFLLVDMWFPGEPPVFRSFFTGFLEISTGTAALEGLPAFPFALPMAAFLLGWGGLSVHCQSLPFWKEAEVPSGSYFGAKLCQGILSAGFTLFALSRISLSTPVMAPPDYGTEPSLLAREMLALWMIAGLYFLLSRKKRMEKDRKKRYTV